MVANPDDAIVKIYHGERLRDALESAGADVTFWAVPSAIHADTINVYYKEYMSRLDGSVQAHPGQQTPGCSLGS